MKLCIEDRFIRGFLSGLVSVVPMLIWDHLSHSVFHFSKVRYLDFMSQLFHGRLPTSLVGALFSQAEQIFFAGFMGAVFVFIVPLVGRKSLLFKSWVFSLGVWFSTYATFSLAQSPIIRRTDWFTSIKDLIGSGLYAVALWLTWSWLEQQLHRKKCDP